MKSKVIKVLYAIFVVLAVSSCSTHCDIYIADAERDSSMTIIHNYTSTIHKGDNLYIYVYSQTPEVVIPFNEETNMRNTHGGLVSYYDFHRINGYDVDVMGNIFFPIIGTISAVNQTEESLEQEIAHQLIRNGYVMDPIVTVELRNFRVSVVGEVARPQELHIDGDRLTIFEALALCGDITMYGQRNNVVVFRNQNGTVVPIEIDLTNKSMFDSKAYYLQSNDIIYVEPSEKYKRMGTRSTNVSQYISLAASVAHLLTTLEWCSGLYDRYRNY